MFIVIVIIVKANSLRSGPLLILHIHPTIATLLLLLLLLLLANVCAIATHVTATRTHQLLRIIIRESQANAYQATQQHILLRKICHATVHCDRVLGTNEWQLHYADGPFVFISDAVCRSLLRFATPPLLGEPTTAAGSRATIALILSLDPITYHHENFSQY